MNFEEQISVLFHEIDNIPNNFEVIKESIEEDFHLKCSDHYEAFQNEIVHLNEKIDLAQKELSDMTLIEKLQESVNSYQVELEKQIDNFNRFNFIL